MHLDTHVLESESQSAAQAGILHGTVVAAGTAETLDVLWAWGAAAVAPARKAMTPDSVFDVASVTKVVATTSACAVCIDRNLLVPDAPATDYLPGLGQFPGSVMRVYDLATHCAGYDNRKFDSYAPDRLVAEAIAAPAQWPARQHYEYACRNFIVLGRIVEQVAGADLATFCSRNVFAPIGMTRTAFGPLRTNLELVVATSQPAGTISDEQANHAQRPIGNAGLFSTATDLALFCQMLLRGGKTAQGRRIFGKSLDWLLRPCNPPGTPRRSFGWDMRPCCECLHRPSALSDAAIGHSGWTGQSVWVDPERGLYTIVLTNRTHAPTGSDNYAPSMRFRSKMADHLAAHVKKLTEQRHA